MLGEKYSATVEGELEEKGGDLFCSVSFVVIREKVVGLKLRLFVHRVSC